MNAFLKLFKEEKPIIGMLHLGRKGSRKEALELTKRELDIYLENGIDGVIAEDYFGDYEEVRKTLAYLYQFKNDIVYGVNYLRDYKIAFRLAEEYSAKFVQLDSISGHLLENDDARYGTEIQDYRNLLGVPVIGGVRFKYQPYLSGRTLKEDLDIGMERSDAIVVTGSGTGIETPIDKAREFKRIIGEFPLIIGAGLNPDNCIESLSIGDAAIVGSYVKDNHEDTGEVSARHVKQFMKKINTIRK